MESLTELVADDFGKAQQPNYGMAVKIANAWYNKE
jgi:hypothetical protein